MIACQNHLFSLPEDIHYLNCAYKAPLLKSSEKAALEALLVERDPSRITPEDFFKEVEDVRKLFGQLIGCKPSDVAIMPSVSYGMTSALNNVPSRAGQHALTIEQEFPSGYLSLKRWCKERSTSLRVIEQPKNTVTPGKEWNRQLIDAIEENTAVVVISSVHWMNGVVFDLDEIGKACRAVGARLIVDGTQSVGAIPMDVSVCRPDALICATYKWLFGPYSVALAYMGPAFRDGKPIEDTWMNRINAVEFSCLADYQEEYTPDAGRYNVGQASNFILMPMLRAALRQILEWTVPSIQSYAEELSKPLREEFPSIRPSGKYQSAHLFTLPLPSGTTAGNAKEELQKKQVFLSVRGESLRVSINVFNSRDDLLELISVMKTLEKS